ncbi:MAG: DUF4192 domain-containing protein [Dactylosporangium sp.]|nr:DUF4192 domain-containing protein [Dactylosporangium sp.]NNJ61593.1 DUF4192 domain-containing protein [Dactylosporangium sp.]
MTRPPGLPRLQLRTPADVLAAVPYLFGFHPIDSVVLLGLRDTALVFHARCDLPAAKAPSGEVLALGEYLTQVLLAQTANAVLLVAFGPAERATPVLLATAQTMEAAGLAVLDQLRATDGRYWSHLCPDPSCCPADGVAYDVEGTVVAAEATLAGCVALPDRETLVRTLGPPEGNALAAILRETRAATARLGERPAGESRHTGQATLDTAVNRYLSGGRLADDELAWLTVLFQDGQQLRDDGLLAIEAAPVQSALAAAHLALWTDVVRRCDPAVVVGPAVLLAYACWRVGDGVRSGVAVERALATDPHCPAATLMAELLRRGVPPVVADRPGGDPKPRPRRRRRRERRRTRTTR